MPNTYQLRAAAVRLAITGHDMAAFSSTDRSTLAACRGTTPETAAAASERATEELGVADDRYDPPLLIA